MHCKAVDFVYLHVEAPDEAGHKGNIDEKIKAIEDFDRRVVKLVVSGLRDNFTDYRVLVLPDHPTPIAIKTHASDPVPFVLFCSKDLNKSTKQSVGFNEKDASASGLFIESGWELMDRFIRG